jgi:NitT/TauT family transport system substrate-binding protein
MKFRMMRWSLLLPLFLVSLPVCGAEKIKIALNWKPEPEFGGFYAAQKNSAFQKHNLDVELIPGGSGTPVVQMIASGQFDYGIVSADEIVMARAHGADVVAVFAVYQTNPQAIMAHAENHFASLGALLDSTSTLGLQRGLPYAEFLLSKYPKSKVKIVPFQGGIANFLADKNFAQQCFVTSEPLEARKKQIAVQTFLVADEGYNPYTTVLATRSNVLKKNARVVKDLVDAVRDGWRTYLQSPQLTNEVMSQLNRSMDLATFNESAQAQKSLIAKDEKAVALGKMTLERWQTLTQQLMTLKVISSAPDASAMFANP